MDPELEYGDVASESERAEYIVNLDPREHATHLPVRRLLHVAKLVPTNSNPTGQIEPKTIQGRSKDLFHSIALLVTAVYHSNPKSQPYSHVESELAQY